MTLGSRDALKEVPLEQITLGGEIADQTILDTLKQMYPAARVVHIYATSELGRCFSVKDGKAGFPAHFLEALPMKASSSSSWVASSTSERSTRCSTPSKMSEAGGLQLDWRATGDQVEQIGDRCYFVGRKKRP